MATNSAIQVTEGIGKNLASYAIAESALTKDVQRVVINDSAGAEITSANPINVTLVSTTSGPTGLTKNEDAVHTSGDIGVFMLGTRQDNPTATAGASGDYQGPAYNAQGAGWVTLTPTTVGGFSYFSNQALSNTAVSVKNTATTLSGYHIFNPSAAVAYIQFYDRSSTPTVGTTAPSFSTGVAAGASITLPMAVGIALANGLWLAATTTATGGTAPATALSVNIFYK